MLVPAELQDADDPLDRAGRERPIRLLYIYPETVGLHDDHRRNPLHYLSKYFQGDFLTLWLVPDAATAAQRAPGIQRACGRFNFRFILPKRWPLVLRRLRQLLFYIATGWRLDRQNGGYDVIVAHGPFSTALAGAVLRLLTGAKLIVEFPGHPFNAFDLHPGRLNRLKRRVAPGWTRLVARVADHVRLLYPGQLDDLKIDLAGKSSVFHEFTTVRFAAPAPADGADVREPYVLFVGFPFYLKGVDVLLRAFQMLSTEFPDVSLYIVGYCPDLTPYRRAADGNCSIHFVDPLPHDEVMRMMSRCSILVLPSRTEAMGRVLLEAMAFRKPVIASDVDGIPHYVSHGETGLLFSREDAADLAAKMRELLRNPELAQQLGEAGYEHVTSSLSEEQYARHFRDMALRALD